MQRGQHDYYSNDAGCGNWLRVEKYVGYLIDIARTDFITVQYEVATRKN
jgi:hypothetical protein